MKVWKEIIKKKMKREENVKEWERAKDLLWDITVYFKSSFLKNNSP